LIIMAEGQDIDLDSVIDRLLEGEHSARSPTAPQHSN